MADAVKQLWPDAQIDAGRIDHSEKFQYDFKMSRPFTPEDLEKIENKMREILKTKAAFSRETLDRAKAKELFRGMGEHLKVARLEDIPDQGPGDGKKA